MISATIENNRMHYVCTEKDAITISKGPVYTIAIFILKMTKTAKEQHAEQVLTSLVLFSALLISGALHEEISLEGFNGAHNHYPLLTLHSLTWNQVECVKKVRKGSGR